MRKTAVATPSYLPRVLIIGDSISVGYTGPVAALLAGEADVRRPDDNCRYTSYGLEHIAEWLGDQKWDVIHFNWGIWDMHHINGPVRTTIQQYQQNLRELVGIMRRTGAKLIWATTTPLDFAPGGGVTLYGKEVPVYNAAALEVMQESGIPVDDLYSAVLPRAEDLWDADKAHFLPQGYEFLASHVAESIRAAL